ncbi:btk-binding protein-related [Anaeramoeba flamelloides]|uniref:Btk-binding protein-related n=1 Tax=Anaeramoeba flamelloides TaxID=1746091 RepID=A0ABQ8XSL1_9EUKA|nr:btk-binding protein-related [Anaeramoeba flamelloides]
MSNSSSLYITGPKKEFYQKDNEKTKYQLPKNENIKDIVSSYQTYQILTESGKVWSLANNNRYTEVPLLDADEITFEKINPVTFFEEKKLFVNSLRMGPSSCYYLCNGDQLYVSGSNYEGGLGIGKSKAREPMPVYVKDKVTKIFAGSHAFNFYFITSNPDLLYACGSNRNGELGVGSAKSKDESPTVVKNFKGSEILTVSSGRYHSVLITNKVQTSSCGNKIKNGLDMIQIACGSNVSFLYLDFKNTLSEDLRLLFESKKFCDCEIGTLGNQIPVHKSLIEFRTKLTIDQIQNKLFGEKSINQEQTLNFLKWIYYDEISDLEKLEQTFNLLELTYPPSVDNTLEKDIAQLYKDDDSKDFKILVKIEDQEEENE